MRIPAGWAALATFLALIFLCLGVAVPLGALVHRIAAGSASLWDPDIRAVAGATAKQAFASTLLAGLIGLPLGLAVARAPHRWGKGIESLLLLPQGVPTVVAATAWVSLLGRSGWLARLDLAYRLEAVILAHVFFNAPWVALLVAQARRRVAPGALETAATLGAGVWGRLRWVIWPEILPAVGAALAQVFAMCSMSFALVLILGGGPPVETLETAMYLRLRGGALDLSAAAACGIWEIALTLIPWWIALWLGQKGPRVARGSSGNERWQESSGADKLWSGLAAGAALALFLPYVSVWIHAAKAAGQATNIEFWGESWIALTVSLRIAALAAAAAVAAAGLAIIAIMAAPSRIRSWAAGLMMLPSGLSVLVLGLGFWLAYGRWVDPFDGSLLAISSVQGVVYFPAAFRILWPVAQSCRKASLETAWLLGASPLRAFWWVEWPRWRGPVVSACALVGGMALGEVAAVSLFAGDRWVPLPLLVSRWMSQYRFEEANVASAVLLAGAVSLMGLVSWLGGFLGEERAHAG